MDDADPVLRSIPAFADLTSDESAVITSVATTRELGTGDVVFEEGEVGGEAYVVLDGAVELILGVGGIETTVVTTRSGGLFGVLAWLDGGVRPVTARASEPSTILAFDATALDRLEEASPAAAARVLRHLAGRLAMATRTIAARFQSVLRWNLEVSGAADIGIDRLITDRLDVTVDLMTGTRVTGTLLKVEQSVAGHELFMLTAEGEIAIVPYHAIARAVFPRGNLLSLDESGGEAHDG